jgi:hypothetical protein
MDPENLRCIESVFAPLLKLLPIRVSRQEKKEEKKCSLQPIFVSHSEVLTLLHQ